MSDVAFKGNNYLILSNDDEGFNLAIVKQDKVKMRDGKVKNIKSLYKKASWIYVYSYNAHTLSCFLKGFRSKVEVLKQKYLSNTKALSDNLCFAFGGASQSTPVKEAFFCNCIGECSCLVVSPWIDLDNKLFYSISFYRTERMHRYDALEVNLNSDTYDKLIECIEKINLS